MPPLESQPLLENSDDESTVNSIPLHSDHDFSMLNDESVQNTPSSWVFTTDSDPSAPRDPMYTYNRWDFCYDHPFYDLNNSILRYDLPLGLGLNDPLQPSANPLFMETMEQVQHVRDDSFPTTVLQAVCPQWNKDNAPVQSDTGANISITPIREILQNYVAITPFTVGHAGTGGPPLMAVGKGDYNVVG